MNKLILKSPVYIFTYLLLLYSILTLTFNFSTQNLVFFVIIITLFTIIGLIIQKINQRINYIDSVISGLILFLILDPLTSLLEVLIITIIYGILKFLRFKNMPIFNPISIALIAFYFISLITPVNAPFVSWWGTAYLDYISIIFLLPALLYSLYKFRKINYFISIFLTFVVIDTLINGFNTFNLITGTMYFAIGIMFIEIKTSPTQKLDQIVIGILAGVILVLFNFIKLPYPILFTILSANLIFFAKKLYLLKTKKSI